jgi:hypothetical protein
MRLKSPNGEFEAALSEDYADSIRRTYVVIQLPKEGGTYPRKLSPEEITHYGYKLAEATEEERKRLRIFGYAALADTADTLDKPQG